jgi:large subunit ribosomal protein L31
MKKEIHPKYNSKAEAKCACGAVFSVGSTKEEINIEICSKCHPFYTGNDKLMDTSGRVDRFKKRQEAASKKTTGK